MTRGVKFGQSVPAPASAPCCCCCLLLQEDGTQVFVRQTETPAEKRATHNPENDSGRRMQGVSAARPLSVVLSRSPTQRPHQMTPGDATVKMVVRCRRLRACFCDRHICALFWSVWLLAVLGGLDRPKAWSCAPVSTPPRITAMDGAKNRRETRRVLFLPVSALSLVVMEADPEGWVSRPLSATSGLPPSCAGCGFRVSQGTRRRTQRRTAPDTDP